MSSATGVDGTASRRRLKYLASINDDALAEDTDPDFEMEYIDIGNVDSSGRISELASYRFEDAPSRARRRVRDGDVIISTVRTYLQAITQIQEPPENLIASTGFAVVRPRRDLFDARYCRFALREPAFLAEVEKRSVGVSYPAINATDLADIPIFVHPLPRQRAIADYLDRETARLDALVAAKERLLKLLAEKRRAIVTCAVTHGLDAVAPVQDHETISSNSDATDKRNLPAGWTNPPVYARYSVQLGKMLDERRISGTHLAPYLRNADIQWDGINTADLPEMDFDEAERDRYALRRGDLLVCEGGDVGRTAEWNGELRECFFQKAIHRLRPITEQDEPRFFKYFMHMAADRGDFTLSVASTIQHLTAEKLRVVRYPAPPRDEQRAIVDYLDRETSRLDTFTTKVRSTIVLLKERRSALIAAAVTGRLDVGSAS